MLQGQVQERVAGQVVVMLEGMEARLLRVLAAQALLEDWALDLVRQSA